MQIFLPYTDIINVAKCLDKRRLHKQIVECKQIIKAITGESEAWKNHPIVKMYSNDLEFVETYLETLEYYWKLKQKGEDIEDDLELCSLNERANCLLPTFINNEYLATMKGRLYVKDLIYYSDFAHYESFGHQNMYFVDGEWKYYKQK